MKKTHTTAQKKKCRARRPRAWFPLFWTCQAGGTRIAQAWPDQDTQAATELQLLTDHFSLADEPGGVIYTTHAVEEGDD